MSDYFLSICALITGIVWMASAPLKTALIGFGYDVIPDDNILIAIITVLFLIVIQKTYSLTGYTDEVLPLYLSLLAFALAAAGVFLYTRLMLLGVICLFAAAFWNKGIVRSYRR